MSTLRQINAATGGKWRRWKQFLADMEKLVEQKQEQKPASPFTVRYDDGAIFIDGPYDSDKFYRLMILSDQGNPIQDVNSEWGGWPFEWSVRTLPDNPQPPHPPFVWQFQEENYISRRWRNKSQYPDDYKSTMYEGVCK